MRIKANSIRLYNGVVARGFDASTVIAGGAVRVRCSQCDALCINGIAAHEHGCPNMTHECKGCDARLTARQGKYCEDCQ